MRNYFIRETNWIYGLIIGLLGFSQGCSILGKHTEMYGPPPPMPEYGCPSVRHIISGRVTDQENNPIKNIQVDFKSKDYYTEKSISTNSKGEYLFEEISSKTNLTYDITFKDIDGEENGGEFIDKTQNATFNSEDFSDANENGRNVEAKKVINVVMEDKKQ